MTPVTIAIQYSRRISPDAVMGNVPEGRTGLGLFIAGRIARLHRRKGRRGRLSLANGGPLGGALFECILP